MLRREVVEQPKLDRRPFVEIYEQLSIAAVYCMSLW